MSSLIHGSSRHNPNSRPTEGATVRFHLGAGGARGDVVDASDRRTDRFQYPVTVGRETYYVKDADAAEALRESGSKVSVEDL